MTKQETFDTVVAALLKQGCKSEIESTQAGIFCAYRGEGGKKCAVGHLIPDKDYREEWEEHSVFMKSSAYPEGSITPVGKFLVSLGHDLDLMQDLQEVHDQYELEDWRQGFYHVAGKHVLDYSE